MKYFAYVTLYPDKTEFYTLSNQQDSSFITADKESFLERLAHHESKGMFVEKDTLPLSCYSTDREVFGQLPLDIIQRIPFNYRTD